jgi:hypothetical protein
VPDFWYPNDGFIEGYNEGFLEGSNIDTVITDPITGTDYLSIGSGQFSPDASLDQAFADVAGVTYDGNIAGVGPGGDGFNLLINGNAYSLDDNGSFSFVGSGYDELTLYVGGREDLSWNVEDVVVTPAVPEPRATFLIPVAMLACLVWLSTRRRATLQ